MKKLITLIIIATNLSLLPVPAGCIINRSGESITVNYMNGTNPLFTTGAITVNGSSDHTADQMILIPSTSIINPKSTANYQNSATNANITIGTANVAIPSFAANTSYVIIAGSTTGTFVANAGLITYDTVTGAATPGNPSPVTPGAGF